MPLGKPQVSGAQLRLPRASPRSPRPGLRRRVVPDDAGRRSRTRRTLRRATPRARGEVAQLVEHTVENRGVAGSIPALAARPHQAPERTARGRSTSVSTKSSFMSTASAPASRTASLTRGVSSPVSAIRQRLGWSRRRRADGRHAVDERHVEVDHDGVRRKLVGQLDRVEPVARRPGDGEVRLTVDQQPERLEEPGVVVREEHLNGRRAQRGCLLLADVRERQPSGRRHRRAPRPRPGPPRGRHGALRDPLRGARRPPRRPREAGHRLGKRRVGRGRGGRAGRVDCPLDARDADRRAHRGARPARRRSPGEVPVVPPAATTRSRSARSAGSRPSTAPAA